MADYGFDFERFMARERFEKIRRFLEDKATPAVAVDLAVVRERFNSLRRLMPDVMPYYALKSNPATEVARELVGLGSCFDIASIYELDQVLALGAGPERVSYGNTIKKAKDIAYAYEKGVRLYATDSELDLRNIAEYAPGSRVLFRLMTDGAGADWPLSRKFGAHPDSIFKMVMLSRRLGLTPEGVSFHVGSQQRDIGQWDNAIATCHYLFRSCEEEGIELKTINLGGGLPAQYVFPTQPIEDYTSEIMRFLHEDFEDNMPKLIIEPGRYMVADSGVMASEVVLVSKKSPSNLYSWVFVDIGKFGGLIETIDESIKYPIFSELTGPTQEVILAGPTCDSMDVLYEDYRYRLPEKLDVGDRLYLMTTGAYTQSYSAVCFNGFPPLEMHVVDTDAM
ncbi:MAG: type III PLP-dependent enzyme [Candidatus Sumerlaeota bacterium]